MAASDTWLQAQAAQRAGELAQALRAFEACVQACEHDAVARAAAQRCRERIRLGLPWDGVEKPAKR